jgi:cobalt/nickel transport system permease protein
MSHIHLPDGILPFWLWAGGYVVAALLLLIAWRLGRQQTNVKRFALLGIFAAMMLLVMTIEIPPYHANLSVVTGIILGPSLAVLAAWIINLFLAFMGHGGITVAGLNTLVVAIEMLAGMAVFHGLRRLRVPLAVAGFLAVVIGLGLGTGASFGIIVAGAPAINASLRAPQAAHEHEEADSLLEEASHDGQLDLHRLAWLMFGLGSIGWILEGILSAAILTALNRVYPGLVIRPDAGSGGQGAGS